jgi:hypothetical protein
MAIDIGELIRRPELAKLENPLFRLLRPGMLQRHVIQINVEHLRHKYFSRITVALAGGLAVLVGEVVGEGFFSLFAVLCSAASAAEALSVSDNPGCLPRDPVFARERWPEPQSGSL